MIRMLKSLFGNPVPERAPHKPVASTASSRTTPPADFRSVSLTPGPGSCKAAKMLAGHCFLLREAPRLPVPGCATPAGCACKFRKAPDRRSGDRRLFGGSETNRWFAGPELRHRSGRRIGER